MGIKRKNIIFLICAFLGSAFLFSLGLWQVQRLEWKENIIQNLSQEYQKNPSENIYDIASLTALGSDSTPILFGSVEGFFLDRALFLSPKTYEGKIGVHVIQPFSLEKGGTILVNRGWLAEEEKENFIIHSDETSLLISGVFRKPEWNRFTPNNNPAMNVWTKPDIEEMSEHFKIENGAPIMLYATGIENNQSLILQEQEWYPRNKHAQYAIFWFFMAFLLLALSIYFIRQTNKN